MAPFNQTPRLYVALTGCISGSPVHVCALTLCLDASGCPYLVQTVGFSTCFTCDVSRTAITGCMLRGRSTSGTPLWQQSVFSDCRQSVMLTQWQLLHYRGLPGACGNMPKRSLWMRLQNLIWFWQSAYRITTTEVRTAAVDSLFGSPHPDSKFAGVLLTESHNLSTHLEKLVHVTLPLFGL